MKLITQLNPKHIFRSKKTSRSVSRSDPPSSFSSASGSGSGSFSSSEEISSTNLKAGSTTPTTVLRSKSHEISNDIRITRRELETLLIRIGAEPLSDEELTMMLTEVGDEEGVINIEKFGEITSSIGGEPACGSEIRDTFDFFDADRDGKISAEELLGVFIAIGDEGCTLEDCKRMIAGVDSDGDGFVCFEDFARMMEHQR